MREKGLEIDDLGPSNDDSVDYPDYGIKLAQAIVEQKVDEGSLFVEPG
ncbi:MAG: hypothetical protein CM1200mP16_03540 [Nitrospina sp.]|nr:MAG: hypothetical protein CM1200mP16_03540 [Nitrospina sp.]